MDADRQQEKTQSFIILASLHWGQCASMADVVGGFSSLSGVSVVEDTPARCLLSSTRQPVGEGTL